MTNNINLELEKLTQTRKEKPIQSEILLVIGAIPGLIVERNQVGVARAIGDNDSVIKYGTKGKADLSVLVQMTFRTHHVQNPDTFQPVTFIDDQVEHIYLEFECKREKGGKASKEQNDRHDALNRNSKTHYFVTDVTEVLEILIEKAKKFRQRVLLKDLEDAMNKVLLKRAVRAK